MFNELKSVPLKRDYTKDNDQLERAIEKVKTKYPHMFLQQHELKNRKFMDEPASPIPMESALYLIQAVKK
jgi:hypothetical protein